MRTVYMGLADLEVPGSSERSLDARQLRLIDEVAEIGSVEGYQVVVEINEADQHSLAAVRARPGLGLITHSAPADIWEEDLGDIRVDHRVVVPGRFREPARALAEVLRRRVERLYPGAKVDDGLPLAALKELIAQSYPKAAFETLGRVAELGSQAALAAVAEPGGAVVEQVTYLEGGNHVAGHSGGEDYVIVGRDSVEASRALLSESLGRAVADQELLDVMAKDLGVRPELVFPVEQPGAFHLDLGLMLVGPKVVVLDDALEAEQLEETWIREDLEGLGPLAPEDQRELDHALDGLRQRATTRAAVEERTAEDLRSEGFTVHRVAGVFDDWRKRMNLMNVIIATNTVGEQYAIVFGADPRAERAFADRLLHELPTQLERIHFLSRDVSMPSGSGGIRCRVKVDGVRSAP